MKPRAYKTNRLLWLAFSLTIFVFNFYGLDIVRAVFDSRFSVEDVFDFEVLYPICASLVSGWLLQCVIVIALSSRRARKAKE